jgi:diguanylate cyclase (GGDEF)-like protein/PAS domain S-box-containing protein
MGNLLEVPPDVEVYLETLLRRSQSPAFLMVDRNGRIAQSGGDVARYGFAGLKEGDRAAETVYLLEGLLPLEEPLVLSRIQTASGGYADMHLFSSNGYDCVLLLDVTSQVSERTEVEEALQNVLEALRESENKFRAVFENSRDAIGALKLGIHALVNPAYVRMFAYASEKELIGLPLLDLIAADRREEVWAQTRRRKEKETPAAYETRGLRKDGSVFDLDVLVSRYQWRGETYQLVILRDITERKAAEAKLVHDAFHDSLTGLPNRVLFIDRLQQALNRISRHRDASLAVLFLDIDRFKLVNDSLGHMAGDSVLVSIAQRLSSCLRSGDTVARIGGDEFTILLEDLHEPEEAFQVADRLQSNLKRPLKWDRQEVFITASIGIAIAGAGSSSPTELLRAADIAMYRAKSQGQARFEVFTPEMHAGALSRLQLESDLHRAVDRSEIGIYLQPIVSLRTNQIEGFEALARWWHPQRGLVLPDDFIPVAEETGLIVRLGDSILRLACHWAAPLRVPGQPCPFVAVNLSVHQLADTGFPQRIEKILGEAGLDPARLHLEITESGIMLNAEAGLRTLRDVRALDVRLYLDDFGFGYSSMNYLHRFPIDGLKIHQSFIAPSDASEESRKIVHTILNLARDLGRETIAEGVETSTQRDWLRQLGCDYFQGHLISPPVRPSDAKALIGL